MDICVKIIFFKILTTLDSHNFGANYQNIQSGVFFCSLGLHQFLSKNFEKKFFWRILEASDENSDFCHFLQVLKIFYSNIPWCTDTCYSLKERYSPAL
jgi:hypothetical protein